MVDWFRPSPSLTVNDHVANRVLSLLSFAISTPPERRAVQLLGQTVFPDEGTSDGALPSLTRASASSVLIRTPGTVASGARGRIKTLLFVLVDFGMSLKTTG